MRNSSETIGREYQNRRDEKRERKFQGEQKKRTEAARERKGDRFNLAFEFLKSRKVGWVAL